MALTQERLREKDQKDTTAVAPPLGTAESTSAGERSRRRLFLAWIAAVASMILLEPVPATTVDPGAWADVIFLSFTAAFAATLVGLRTGASWALKASGAAAAVGVVIAVACAVTDHHIGWWWAGELAAFTALGAMTLRAATHR